MWTDFELAFQSVIANWRHSLATLASVSLGLIAIAAIHGYNVDSDNAFTNGVVYRTMTGHIIVEAQQTGDEPIEMQKAETAIVMDELKKLDTDVHSVVRFLQMNGIIASKKASFKYMGIGYDVVQGEITRGPHWAWNTPFGKPLRASDKHEILVGKGLAELLGCDTAGREPRYQSDGSYLPYEQDFACFHESLQLTALTSSNQMNAWDANIVGVADAGVRDMEDYWLVMPLKDAQVFANSEQVSMLGITLKNPERVPFVKAKLDALFLAHKLPFKATYWKDHESATLYREMMNIMSVFEKFMLLIIAFVCTLSMVNTMTRNVDQRIHEIGTLRAIGYKSGFITRVFAWEGFFLGLAGSVLGIVGIFLILSAVNGAGILYYPAVISQKAAFRIAATPETYVLLALFLSTCSAATAALVTKLRISKNIAELLQSNA